MSRSALKHRPTRDVVAVPSSFRRNKLQEPTANAARRIRMAGSHQTAEHTWVARGDSTGSFSHPLPQPLRLLPPTHRPNSAALACELEVSDSRLTWHCATRSQKEGTTLLLRYHSHLPFPRLFCHLSAFIGHAFLLDDHLAHLLTLHYKSRPRETLSANLPQSPTRYSIRPNRAATVPGLAP
ncbi:hypothetical protein TRVL_10410 [Trypanosoma vivax]|nr:hypothetical protein TRVL_10410 [Trypanosoma vivax]